jgi:hypothetical protein
MARDFRNGITFPTVAEDRRKPEVTHSGGPPAPRWGSMWDCHASQQIRLIAPVQCAVLKPSVFRAARAPATKCECASRHRHANRGLACQGRDGEQAAPTNLGVLEAWLTCAAEPVSIRREQTLVSTRLTKLLSAEMPPHHFAGWVPIGS